MNYKTASYHMNMENAMEKTFLIPMGLLKKNESLSFKHNVE